MNKVAYLTWIYPKAIPFFDDYLESINNQSTFNIDLYYINNGLNESDLTAFIEKISVKYNLKVISTDSSDHIYNKVINSIIHLKENHYDYLIFGDVDDVFSDNRFAEYINAFDDKFTVFYNNLYDLEHKSEIFKEELPRHVSLDTIKCRNFLGMSNTAINLNNVSVNRMLQIEWRELDVFDWFFYSILLGQDKVGICVSNAKTFYRIHNSNQVGRPCFSSRDSLINALKVILNHNINLEKYLLGYSSNQTELEYILEKITKISHVDLVIINGKCKYWWDLDLPSLLESLGGINENN